MNKFLKRFLCILFILSLILNIGCQKSKPAPDREADIGDGLSVFVPEVGNETELLAEDIKEAVISSEEEKLLWSYKYLNDDEKQVYRIMLTMVRNFYEGWARLGYLGKNCSTIVAKAFRAVGNDFPEYYWMPASYYINISSGEASVSFKKNGEGGYAYTTDEVYSNAEEFDDAILRITKKANKAETLFEKEVIIHDELCKRVVYDSEFDAISENDIYSSFGALVFGHAVCEGYARAFKLLCKYVGIECILITGDSKGVGHMWNMVNLDGNWYHVDVTWDDLRADPLHTYLNLTELSIRIDHNIDITYNSADASLISQGSSFNFFIPEAKSTDYNYFEFNNLILGDDPVNTFCETLIDAFKNGETKAELLFENSTYQKDFKENYEDYVVEIQKAAIEKMGKMEFKLQTISFTSSTCIIYFAT